VSISTPSISQSTPYSIVIASWFPLAVDVDVAVVQLV
jgi:hypothetical protein